MTEKVQIIVGVRPFTFDNKDDKKAQENDPNVKIRKVTLYELYIGEPIDERYGVGFKVEEKRVCQPELIDEAFGDWKKASLRLCHVYCDTSGRPIKITPVE